MIFRTTLTIIFALIGFCSVTEAQLFRRFARPNRVPQNQGTFNPNSYRYTSPAPNVTYVPNPNIQEGVLANGQRPQLATSSKSSAPTRLKDSVLETNRQVAQQRRQVIRMVTQYDPYRRAYIQVPMIVEVAAADTTTASGNSGVARIKANSQGSGAVQQATFESPATSIETPEPEVRQYSVFQKADANVNRSGVSVLETGPPILEVQPPVSKPNRTGSSKRASDAEKTIEVDLPPLELPPVEVDQ